MHHCGNARREWDFLRNVLTSRSGWHGGRHHHLVVFVASVVDSSSKPIDTRVTSNAAPGTKMNTDHPNGTVENASVRTAARSARLSGRPPSALPADP